MSCLWRCSGGCSVYADGGHEDYSPALRIDRRSSGGTPVVALDDQRNKKKNYKNQDAFPGPLSGGNPVLISLFNVVNDIRPISVIPTSSAFLPRFQSHRRDNSLPIDPL